jgi:hypothetical protein
MFNSFKGSQSHGWFSNMFCCSGTQYYRFLPGIRGCIQKFPDWPPGARTANDTALCYYVQLYRYFVSQSSESCRHNPLCCFPTSVYRCCLFRYRQSPETFEYILVHMNMLCLHFYQPLGSVLTLTVNIRNIHYSY